MILIFLLVFIGVISLFVFGQLEYCISGHASLLGADILYIEVLQACAELIYCISGHASVLDADLR